MKNKISFLLLIAIFLPFYSIADADDPAPNPEARPQRSHSVCKTEVSKEIKISKSVFGYFDDPNATIQDIIKTTKIPFKNKRFYGYKVFIQTSLPNLQLKHVLTLPKSLPSWPNHVGDDPSVKLSKDLKSSTVEETITSHQGLIFAENIWFIVPDDYTGSYNMKLYINNNLSCDINFEIFK